MTSPITSKSTGAAIPRGESPTERSPSASAGPAVSIGLHRRRAAALLGALRGGVLSRELLREIDIDADAIARECRNERWRMHGWNTVALHTGELSLLAQHWRALWETNEATAVLDGVSALQALGLKGFTESTLHVSVLRAASVRHCPGITVHRVSDRPQQQVVSSGLPRTRPEVAAIRGAQWAVSDRQAALILAMTIQQHLTTPERLVAASETIRGRSRRAFIPRIVRDIANGAQSLGELDFVTMCRRYAVPPPAHQALRHLPDGTAYLDAAWEEAKLAVEIDVSGHRWGLNESADHLRQNAVTLGGDLVLRMNLVGLRLHEREFMSQVRTGYQTRTEHRAS